MKKRLFHLLPLLFIVSSCGGKPYSYVNPEKEEIDYGPDVEDNVYLDGLANEVFYNQNQIYRIDHKDGENRYAEVIFGFANQGLLAHAYVHENTIYENIAVNIYEQDSFELYINPNIQKNQLYSNCVQFRISPLLRTETWIGMKSPVDDYTWTYYYVPFRYATKINGKVITSEEQYFDEEYTNSEGVEYEFYIPYSSLGLDYNPKGLDILPAMVTTNSLEMDDHTWSSYREVDIVDLKNYISVGNRVYKSQDGNIFNTDFSTPGFILDHQLDATQPYVVNYGFKDQYAYFNTYNDVFYAKSVVTFYRNLDNDQYPKVGIGTINEYGTKVMLFDPRPNKDEYKVLLVDKIGDENWLWDEAPVGWYGPETYSQPITIEIVRHYLDLYFYMNNHLLFSSNALILESADSYPILMTMNHSAKFEKNYLTTNLEVVETRINNEEGYLDLERSTYGFSYDNGVYSQMGTNDQYGIFKTGGKNYSLTVSVDIGNALNGDLNPKIGIGEISASKVNAYLLDPKPSKSNYEIVHVTSNNDNNWVWGDVGWSGPNTYNRSFEFIINRNDGITKFYVDDELLFIHDNEFGDEISYPMFFTMNHSGTFEILSYEIFD